MGTLGEIFKQTRTLEPSDDLRRRLLRTIGTTRQVRPRMWMNAQLFRPQARLAVGAGLLALLIGFGGFLKFGMESRTTIARKALEREAAELDFSIQLGEAKYFTEAANDITALLGEIRGVEAEDPPIDTLLEHVIF